MVLLDFLAIVLLKLVVLPIFVFLLILEVPLLLLIALLLVMYFPRPIVILFVVLIFPQHYLPRLIKQLFLLIIEQLAHCFFILDKPHFTIKAIIRIVALIHWVIILVVELVVLLINSIILRIKSIRLVFHTILEVVLEEPLIAGFHCPPGFNYLELHKRCAIVSYLQNKEVLLNQLDMLGLRSLVDSMTLN